MCFFYSISDTHRLQMPSVCDTIPAHIQGWLVTLPQAGILLVESWRKV